MCARAAAAVKIGEPDAAPGSDAQQVRIKIGAMFADIAPNYLSWQIGIPLPDQKLPQRSEMFRVIQAFTWFGGSIAASTLSLPLLGSFGFAVLPWTMSATVASARYLQLAIYHHAAHGNVISARAAKGLGELVATLLVIKPFGRYALAHTLHHSPQALSTDAEETVIYLENVGIHPGLPFAANKAAFLRALVSPKLHTRSLVSRITDQLRYGSRHNKAALLAYLAGVVGFAAFSGWWLPVALAWALPLTVGYQVAQTARLAVEHRWLRHAPAANGRRTARDVDELTVPVYCAIRPPCTKTFRALAAFYLGMLANAYVRWVVLPGDAGPSHDMHHDKPLSDWANHISARVGWLQRRAENGSHEALQPAWGYGEALNLCLASFSNAEPSAIEAPAKIRDLKARRDS